MLTIKKIAACCIALLSSIPSAFAWNATGHEVIAEIAWEHLTPTAREKALKLVNTFNIEYPKIHTFIQMAPWADQLRSQKIEYYRHWHYVNIPFSTDATTLKNITDTDNAIWAMKKLRSALHNPRANPYERARALAFIIHIVGDLHQPLHTVSLISYALPEGDRGGNLYMLASDTGSASNNLHHLWDGGAGLFKIKSTSNSIRYMAYTLMHEYPTAHFGSQITSLDENCWTKEGMATARRYVYRTPEKQAPTVPYIAKSQQIAAERATLAGYRLAELLNQLL